MRERQFTWDFFLAHAGADASAATHLYDLLAPRKKVFLDSKSILLGDEWDYEIAEAQKNSLITVVLVSSHTDRAYYQREEIAAAIQLARENEHSHRVVPVYLAEAYKSDVPYGLRLKHGISVAEAGGMAAVAQKLLQLIETITRLGPENIKIVNAKTIALGKISYGNAKERIDGFKEVMRVFGPLVVALLGIVFVILMLIGLCIFTPLLQENQTLAISILASMFTFALGGLMIVLLKSMSLAQQIAKEAP